MGSLEFARAGRGGGGGRRQGSVFRPPPPAPTFRPMPTLSITLLLFNLPPLSKSKKATGELNDPKKYVTAVLL